MTQIKPLVFLQITLSLAFSVAIKFAAGSQESLSFLVGALFATANLMVLIYIVTRLFKKKSVAWTAAIIIFKYLILGLSLYFLVENQYLKIPWFVVGLSVLLPALVGFAVMHIKTMQRRDLSDAEKKERDDHKYGTF